MIDIAYIILHYMAVNDTCKCVESIRLFSGKESYKIIIVDNNSPDNSIDILREKYQVDNDIYLIHNSDNLGFAKGNNVGFIYAKKQLNAKFIVLLNNDTCLIQKGFYEKVCEAYNKYEFAVMGPMIMTNDGKYTSNPHGFKLRDQQDVKQAQKVLMKQKFLVKWYLDFLAYNVVKKILNKFKVIHEQAEDMSKYCKIQENVELHGAFMVFSEKYINLFDGLDSRTYMYFEEGILFLHLMNANLRSLYFPEIIVFHKEDSSTDLMTGNKRSKKLFTLEHNIKSMNIYLEILDEYSKNKDL